MHNTRLFSSSGRGERGGGGGGGKEGIAYRVTIQKKKQGFSPW